MHKGILKADRCTAGDYNRKEDAAFLTLDYQRSNIPPVPCPIHCHRRLRTGLREYVHLTQERCIRMNAQLATLKNHGALMHW